MWSIGFPALRSTAEVGPDSTRRAEAVALDGPLLIVLPPELPQGLAQPGDGGEVPDSEQALLQRPDEAFGHTGAFGLTHQAQRTGQPQEVQLPLEVVAHVGTAVIIADRQARGNPQGEVAEVLADALTDRFQRLEAIARLRGVDADALTGAMVNRDEDTDPAFRLNRRVSAFLTCGRGLG
jgi:hypothetical protein